MSTRASVAKTCVGCGHVWASASRDWTGEIDGWEIRCRACTLEQSAAKHRRMSNKLFAQANAIIVKRHEKKNRRTTTK